MKLEPLPELVKNGFDTDALVYFSDTELYYNDLVDPEVIEDIKNKQVQIYGGYYDYSKGWRSPKIYLLGRGVNSGKFKLKIQNFKPYCYIMCKKNEEPDAYSYLGVPLTKIVFEGHPSKVKFFREKSRRKGYGIPYEADIPFVRRFLCDMYDYFKPAEPVKPKIAVFDIETNHPISDDIIAFSINDMEDTLYYSSKFDTPYHSQMALDLYDKLKEYDIVTGWNVDFDVDILQKELVVLERFTAYASRGRLYTRDVYENQLKLAHPNMKVKEIHAIIDDMINLGYLDEYQGYIKLGSKRIDSELMHDVSKLDMLKVSKKMKAKEIKGKWSLDNAGLQLVGLNKVHIGAKQIRELNEEELYEYNVMDCVIPEIIDNTLGGIEGHLILAWSLQSVIDDTILTAVVNDIALLRAYHKSNIILPSRVFKEHDKEKKYKAAEPDARHGVYDNILALDLKHAYPSAVISKNISAETKDPNGKNEVVYENKDGEIVKTCFNDDHSVFIDTLEEIMLERKNVKDKLKEYDKGTSTWKRYKSIDFALKTQAAAFSHGIFGWANSRMRDYEVADAITGLVRNDIDMIKENCDKMDRPWVYAHTDSTYLEVKTQDECEAIAKKLNDLLAEKHKGDILSPVLEIKGFKKRGFIHSAARNVLIPLDGNVDDPETWEVTGMNFIRSEVPDALVDIETELIKLKLKGKSIDDLKKRLKEMVKELPSIDRRKLGLIKPLTKPIASYGRVLKDGSVGGQPGHINALIKAQKENKMKNVSVGDKFMVLPIYTNETTGVRVIKRKKIDIAFDIEKGLSEEYSIDFEYYLRSNLWGKINQMFDMTPRELEKEILDEDVKAHLFVELI